MNSNTFHLAMASNTNVGNRPFQSVFFNSGQNMALIVFYFIRNITKAYVVNTAIESLLLFWTFHRSKFREVGPWPSIPEELCKRVRFDISNILKLLFEYL